MIDYKSQELLNELITKIVQDSHNETVKRYNLKSAKAMREAAKILQENGSYDCKSLADDLCRKAYQLENQE